MHFTSASHLNRKTPPSTRCGTPRVTGSPWEFLLYGQGWATRPGICKVNIMYQAKLKLQSVATVIMMVLAVLGAARPVYGQTDGGVPKWDEPDAAGNAQIRLYFFWSVHCPHCLEAHPFVSALPEQYPWLLLEEREVSSDAGHALLYQRVAAAAGEEARFVPAFVFCGQMIAGYDHADTTGAQLVAALSACQVQTQAHYDALRSTAGQPAEGAPVQGGVPEGSSAGEVVVAPAAEAATVTLPWLGTVALARVSLPLFTVIVAALDAFNPCAFFVLMFLLSLLVHTNSRRRMLLIGGIFVLFSGLLYFLLMAALLNVFLWAGELRGVTMVAGLVAVGMALINIKDFVWFKRGPSLTIPEGAKPGLFQRMRTLVNAGRLPVMLASTVLLALAANSYELLCTSGFPMIYTRALTLHQLSQSAFYGYLALYNLVYVLPLLAIVALFAHRLGARKLTEAEGRALKLLSGTMMGQLGLLLIVAPERLNNPLVAVLLLFTAVAVTWIARKVAAGRFENRIFYRQTDTRPQTGQGMGTRKPSGKRRGHGRSSAGPRRQADVHPR